MLTYCKKTSMMKSYFSKDYFTFKILQINSLVNFMINAAAKLFTYSG